MRLLCLEMTEIRMIGLAGLAAMLSSCTGPVKDSFRLLQQEQVFQAQLGINTKMDLLWVVDNSSSMDVSQDRLRKGFSSFAKKYLQPTWDIRLAVITTDSYLAHSQFGNYLNRVIPGTVGWKSSYIKSVLEKYQNPPSNPGLVNLITGAFDKGLRYGDLVPSWGKNFGRLLPGVHDGPIAGLCSEVLPYFFTGNSQCKIRDRRSQGTGVAGCTSVETTSEDQITQCVNTTQNDSVHSGRPILNTLPNLADLESLRASEIGASEIDPATPIGKETLRKMWSEKMIRDFTVNVSVGSNGHGSERGIGSVMQFIMDNERTETAFFRPDSLRGIIFIGDEDDQTLLLEEHPIDGLSPFSRYACDQKTLIELNGISVIAGTNGFCCAGLDKNCYLGLEGTACPTKTVDDHTYSLSVCAKREALLPVENAKIALDQFFNSVDGNPDTPPNYFIVSIVPLTGAGIKEIQSRRFEEDVRAKSIRVVAVDRGDRYIALGELVKNGSVALDLTSEDYSPILDAIGKSIIENKSTFTLTRAPLSSEDMTVKILHENGSFTLVTSDQFEIRNKSIIFKNIETVLSFKSSDRVVINYQPKTLY